MEKLMKKFGWMLAGALAIVLWTTVAPMTAQAEENQTGFVDGTNKQVSWTYDAETKTVTVTGSGQVMEYGMEI